MTDLLLLVAIVLGVVSLAVLDAILLRRRIAGQVVSLQATIDALAHTLAQIGANTNGKARAILEQSPYPVMVHDREGRIVYANYEAAAILGGTPEQIIGTTYADRGDKQEGVETFHEFRQLALLGGKSYEGEISYRTPGEDVRRRYVFRVAPFRTGSIISGTVTTFRDISSAYMSRFS